MTLIKSLSAPQPPLWSHGWTQHHFWSSLLAASQDPEISLSSQHMLLGHPQLEEIRAFPQHCLSIDFSVFRLCPEVKKIIHHYPLLNHPFSLFFKGRKSEAEKFFLKAIELDPTKGNCYMHYGEWWCFSHAPTSAVHAEGRFLFFAGQGPLGGGWLPSSRFSLLLYPSVSI